METLNIAHRVDITSQIKNFTPFVLCMQGMFLFMSLPENERTENELHKRIFCISSQPAPLQIFAPILVYLLAWLPLLWISFRFDPTQSKQVKRSSCKLGFLAIWFIVNGQQKGVIFKSINWLLQIYITNKELPRYWPWSNIPVFGTPPQCTALFRPVKVHQKVRNFATK